MRTETWFRCITKKVLWPHEVTAPDRKDYLWYEMGFFTKWSGDEKHCKVLCIGTPPELRQQLQGVLAASPELRLEDTFALLRFLLDEVVKLYDAHTWQVTKMVRKVEKVPGLHSLAHHVLSGPTAVNTAVNVARMATRT